MPNVLVTIRQYNSQTFLVQGSVRNPGPYQAEGRPSLMMMIAWPEDWRVITGRRPSFFAPTKQTKPATALEADTQISSLQDQTPDPAQSTQTPAGGALRPRPQTPTMN